MSPIDNTILYIYIRFIYNVKYDSNLHHTERLHYYDKPDEVHFHNETEMLVMNAVSANEDKAK